MSKAITEKSDEHGPGKRWDPGVETAPSVVREDEPTTARLIGLIGASCVIFGGIALLVGSDRFGAGKAVLILAVGIVGLLSHAAYDRDLQIRRLYWGTGLMLIAVGFMLSLIPFDGAVGGLFGIGYACMGLALLFLLATQHHETDPGIREITRLVFLGVGAVGAFCVFVLSNFLDTGFLVPYGALAGLMGLIYLIAFVSQTGLANDSAYRLVLGMGALGLGALVVGLLRVEPSAGANLALGLVGVCILGCTWQFRRQLPAGVIPGGAIGVLVVILALLRALFQFGSGSDLELPLVPWGLVYISVGLLFIGVCIAASSDRPLVVLMRRELSSYFFSPLIYLILIGLSVVAWWYYQQLLSIVSQARVTEPMTRIYLWGLGPILTVTFMVPVLTMRLLSEEHRSGSLELLLTAPVNESTVVLSKFLAAFVLFMLLWAPWWLFLIALRIGGGVPFDYRSLFSFIVVLMATGAGFVAMGLFFSSLTKNQVASAVLCFAGMMIYLGVYLLRFQIMDSSPNSPWLTVVNHMDYVELWKESFNGTLIPKFLLFHVSAAVVWLFMTVKVLEIRRWA